MSQKMRWSNWLSEDLGHAPLCNCGFRTQESKPLHLPSALQSCSVRSDGTRKCARRVINDCCHCISADVTVLESPLHDNNEVMMRC